MSTEHTTSASSNPENLILQELESRIAAFAHTIKVQLEQCKVVLADLGVTTDQPEQSLQLLDDENSLTFGDLYKAFVSTNMVKVPILRLGIKHLRGKTEDNSDIVRESVPTQLIESMTAMVETIQPKTAWTTEKLLNAYLDDDESRAILAKRTKGRPCIVFQTDGSINIPASLAAITIAQKQPTYDTFKFKDTVVRLRRVGYMPNAMVDESPFCAGKTLVNGYCSETSTDWTGISTPSRVLAHIHVNQVEKGRLSLRDYRSICSDARLGFDTMRLQYPEAAIIYDELEKEGNLPKLRINTQTSTSHAIDRGY